MAVFGFWRVFCYHILEEDFNDLGVKMYFLEVKEFIYVLLKTFDP